MASETTRSVRLDVTTGLYVLRYVASIDVRSAPYAFVRPSDDSYESVSLVGAPGIAANELAAPGSSLVLVVRSKGSIEVSLTSVPGSANLDAKFSLDLIATGMEPKPASPVLMAAKPSTAATLGRGANDGVNNILIDVLAHVSRRGDITQDADGWIAGPKAPSAIEGFEIRTRGADIGIAAQFRNIQNPQIWSPWIDPGMFIGTRQKACPLTGLKLRLVGSDAPNFELQGSALFIGSPKMEQRGRELEFSVPGASDALIGLRLLITAAAAKSQEHQEMKTSRVRVFR